MHVENRNGYRLIVGGPVPPQAEAITLGNTILVRKRSCNDHALMAHELVHVRQFQELGTVHFLAKYVGSYLRFRLTGFGHMAAYRRIPLEVEASWVSRLHKVTELEPGTTVSPRRSSGALTGKSVRAPRPVSRLAPRIGWNRSKAPRPDPRTVQAAMASRPTPKPQP